MLQKSDAPGKCSTSGDANDREEKQESGGISFKTYKMILNAVNNRTIVVIVMFAFFGAQLAVSSTDYLVSRWYAFIEIHYQINIKLKIIDFDQGKLGGNVDNKCYTS